MEERMPLGELGGVVEPKSVLVELDFSKRQRIGSHQRC
jgi:hypothetical protein